MCSSLRACLTTDELVGRVVDDEVARQADGGRLAPAAAGRISEWNVETHMRLQSDPSERLDARPRISSAALFVKRDGEHFVGTGVARRPGCRRSGW